MRRIRQTNVVFAALLVLGLGGLPWLAACGGGGGGGGQSSAPTGKVTVSGRVTGSGGLEGVTVTAGGVSDTTDADGLYALTEVPVPPSGRLVITFEKEGYATFQRSLPVEPGESYAVGGKLLRYDVKETVDPTVEQELEGKDPSDQTTRVKLTLPGDSVEAQGDITVRVALGDPTTPEGRAAFPGDYMAASSAEAEPDTPLESVAFTEITITDEQGNEITQLNKPATVQIRLPEEFQQGGARAGTYRAGDTIEWWSYDETRGVWIREDADPDTAELDDAKVVEDQDGILYAQAKVTHLTWWNADRPLSEHACICATAEDGQGAPLPGAELVAEGVSYNGVSYPALTGEDGKACVNVKRSADAQDPETVRVYIRAGDVRFDYDVTDPTEGEVDEDLVYTPTAQGSTLDGSGTCKDLTNPIRVTYDGRITGTVTYEHSDTPVPDFTLYTNIGPRGVTDDEGRFEIQVPLNREIWVFAPGLASRSATVTDAGTPVVLDFELPNRAPVIGSVTRNPATSPLDPDTPVIFTAEASDPDGDSLTYQWTADAGAPSSATGPTFSWTAPAEATTAHVTVTVTDDKGASASQTLDVIVGGGPGQSVFKVVVKDDPAHNSPVEGVYAILHSNDGGVEKTLQTGADGTADFGSVGRDRVTFTLAWQDGPDSPGRRQLYTFVDVPVAEVVFYTGADFDLDVSSDLSESPCADPVPTVEVTATDIPAEAQGLFVSPFNLMQPLVPGISGDGTGLPGGLPGTVSLGSGTFQNVKVCPGHLETDGQLSLLVAAGTAGDGGSGLANVLEYGFLTDQTVSDGSTYEVSLNRQPTRVGWTTEPETPADAVVAWALRQGVLHTAGLQAQQPASSTGTIQVAAEFPADTFLFGAGTSDGGTAAASIKRYDTVPGTVTIPMPSWTIDSASFDADTHTASWTASGTNEANLLALGWTDTGGSVETTWTVLLSPEETGSWTAVSLPEPVSGWIDLGGSEGGVSILELYPASGFDDLWAKFTQGLVDLYGSFEEILEKSRGFPASAGRAAARTPAPAGSGPHTGALRALSHLVRR